MWNKFIIMTVVFGNFAFAQDPIFTQFFMVPETLNTSFTGSKESTSAGIIHRTQWPGVDFSINTQFAYVNNFFEEINSGLGVSILNHKETKTRYNFTQANLNYSYAIQLNETWFFRPSISLGFGNKDFGFQNLLLEDQINIFDGIINTTSIDPALLNEKINFFDFSTSFLFNNERTWIGFTMRHLNRPNISMAQNGNKPIDPFFSIHSAIEFPFYGIYTGRYVDEESIFLVSNFMYQGPYNRFDIGPQYVNDKFSIGILAATNPIKTNQNSHFLTSINAAVGFKYEGFKFGYSYDFNTSKIGRTGGVYELSISYDFNNTRNCFGCPNYY